MTGKRVLGICMLAGSLLLSGCGEKEDTSPAAAQEAEDVPEESGAAGYRSVVWQGETYEYNDHLSNFLFLGIDKRETAETETGRADAGQADALYLVSWDRVENSVTLISIPRDTMTPIEVFDTEGNSLGLTEQHISLSYGYGDGKYESLELASTAVSALLYGMPVQGACAMSLDGITALLESFGEVTVTVPNDSLEEEYPEFQEGAEAVITAENAETYLRWRNLDETQSAIARMERQQSFLAAFGEAAAQKYGENPESAAELYDSLSPWLVTDIGKDWFVKLAEGLSKGGEPAQWTIPGEGVEGEPFDEYHVDSDALYEAVIETFYVKAE